jgi:hypothetical protein
MTDYKQLCAELVRIANALDGGAPLVGNQGQALDGYSALAAFRDVATRARAALAQPEPEGPSDEELLALMPETMRDEFSYAAKVCSDATGGQVKPGIFRVALNTAALEYAQAVLSRWGNG